MNGIGYQVDHDELLEDAILAYETKESLFIWGRTGIGKSQTVRRAAEVIANREGRKFTTKLKEIDGEHFFLLDIRLSYRKPTDLTGVMYRDEQRMLATWLHPDWVYAVSEEREKEEGIEIKGIIFFDELNLAPPLVQNAAYEIVLDRRMNGLELAKGVAIIAAGNLSEDEAYTFEMPKPLRTRFTHVILKPPIYSDGRKGWFFWALENGIDPRIVAFLGFRRDMLFQETGEVVFPTPRSWEKASKLMKGRDDETAWKAVAKACGPATGQQFKQFLEIKKATDVVEILNNPQKFDELPIDMKFATIASMAELDETFLPKIIDFTAKISVGIYDDRKLSEIASKLSEAMKNMNDEEVKRVTKEFGNRQPELAIMLLRLMKAKYPTSLVKAVKGKYSAIFADMLKFVVV